MLLRFVGPSREGGGVGGLIDGGGGVEVEGRG